MKHNVIRYSMIVLLTGMAALAASRANAQERRRNEIQIESLSWGISTGQLARIGVTNFGSLDGSVRSISPVIARMQLLDTEGEVIAQSGEIEVPAGKIRFWDVPREQLPAGEPRVQVRGKYFVIFPSTRPFDVKRDQLPFTVTLELIDAGTGRTSAIDNFSNFQRFLAPPPPR